MNPFRPVRLEKRDKKEYSAPGAEIRFSVTPDGYLRHMNQPAATDQYPTGQVCPGCDCEVLASGGGRALLLECDCGRVTAIGPELPSAA